MDNKPSLSDVARVAGVTKPTVSIVLNGKGDKGRICRDTQNRIRAVARELGYQKQSTMPVPLPNPTTGGPSKMAGLILSASSPASSLALIPGLDSRISGAGCRLVVVTLPPDPAAARARILALIQEGFVSFICCPSVYEAVAAVSTVPVTKLEKAATGGTVAELPIVELLRKAPVMAAPIPPPVVAPKPAQATPETPPQVQPQQPPEVPQVPQSAPTPEPISEQSPTPQPVAVVEPDPVSPPQEEPEVTPVLVDTPMAAVEEEPPTAAEPPVETPSPEVLPEEPAPMPEVTPVEEPAVVTPAPVEPVAATPSAEPEPAPVTPEPEPVSPAPVEPVVVEPEEEAEYATMETPIPLTATESTTSDEPSQAS